MTTVPRATGCCAKCSGVRTRPGQRYCGSCHAAYMREWRKDKAVSPAQIERGKVRSIATQFVKRAGIKPLPCVQCSSTVKVEKHHPNYKLPLHFLWLCRACHVALHTAERKRSAPAPKTVRLTQREASARRGERIRAHYLAKDQVSA